MSTNNSFPDEINSLLKELSSLSICNRISIIGSIARGSSDPKDLDIVVDLRSLVTEAQTLLDLDRHVDGELSRLLKLGRNYYGWFDPFLIIKNSVFVRNAESTEWEKSRLTRKELLASAVSLTTYMKKQQK